MQFGDSSSGRLILFSIRYLPTSNILKIIFIRAGFCSDIFSYRLAPVSNYKVVLLFLMDPLRYYFDYQQIKYKNVDNFCNKTLDNYVIIRIFISINLIIIIMKVSYKVTVKEPGRKASIHYAEASNQAEAIKIIRAYVLMKNDAVLTAELDYEPTYIQNN